MTATARIAAVVAAAAVFLFGSAASAFAATPVGWPTEGGRTTGEAIVFYGGWTVGLIVVITLFALLTARRNFTPAQPEDLPAETER